jgi:hypothetical protein
MKIAILALTVLAIIGPRAISVIAYKFKGPWTNPQIDAAGAALRWSSIGGIVILIAMEMLT